VRAEGWRELKRSRRRVEWRFFRTEASLGTQNLVVVEGSAVTMLQFRPL
jgi:hypothetical protein